MSSNDKDTSFLQAILANTSYDLRRTADEAWLRPSRTPSMSTRSLEMCTETLGNETGCTIDLNLDEYSYLLSEQQSFTRTKIQKEIRSSRSRSFPPPLSSINGVKVQAHREGGRLRMTAISNRRQFKSEREKGRLRVFVVKEVAENVKEDSAKFNSSRCSGDGSATSRVPTLPLCVAIS